MNYSSTDPEKSRVFMESLGRLLRDLGVPVPTGARVVEVMIDTQHDPSLEGKHTVRITDLFFSR